MSFIFIFRATKTDMFMGRMTNMKLLVILILVLCIALPAYLNKRKINEKKDQYALACSPLS